MAGITANTTSVTMASSEGADVTKTGFSTGEVCTLAAEPAGSSHLWTLISPAGSTASLSDDSAAGPQFKLDRAGVYSVVCIVDGSTVYKIRMEATQVSTAFVANSLRFAAVDPSTVATPSSGRVLFIDSTNSNALSLKDSSGTVTAV